MIRKVYKVASHRNGVSGEPFHVVLFDSDKDGKKVGVVFEAPGHVAVLDIDLLKADVIEFSRNSWRGDQYESELRQTIQKFESGAGAHNTGNLAS